MQTLQRIARVSTPDKSPLDIETHLRALRSTVWVGIFLAQELQLHHLIEGLGRVLREIDRLIGEAELA